MWNIWPFVLVDHAWTYQHNMNGGSPETFLIINIGEDAEDSSIKKFTGDNEVSFNKWILQFEAQSGALGVENN